MNEPVLVYYIANAINTFHRTNFLLEFKTKAEICNVETHVALSSLVIDLNSIFNAYATTFTRHSITWMEAANKILIFLST